MNDESNPYAPPQVEESFVPEASSSSREGIPYFTVSITKLAVLSVMTFGLYEFYWMYKQWKAIRDHDGAYLSPFWRAFFSLFFVHKLFDDIRRRSYLADLQGNIPAGFMAVIYIVCALLGRIGDKADSNVLWLCSFLTVLPLTVMQSAVNRYVRHCDKNAPMNENISAWNMLAILLGGGVWALVLYGLTNPE